MLLPSVFSRFAGRSRATRPVALREMERKTLERSRSFGARLRSLRLLPGEPTGDWEAIRVRRRRRDVDVCIHPARCSSINDVLVLQVASALRVVTHTRLTEVNVNLSDAGGPPSDTLVFCSRHDGAILIPDPDFVSLQGYAEFRSRAFDPAANWWQRSTSVLWRGSTTGDREASLAVDPAEMNERVRMCLMLRDEPGVDARLSNVVQCADIGKAKEELAAAGLMGDWLRPRTWLGVRYAIDIDGNSNAFQNFFTRLLIGNCVIKVVSARGYRQWYYDRVVPWVHFVPVRGDMADLVEKIGWCRAHPEACFEIACAGRELALSMTFEREMAGTVGRLNALPPLPGSRG